MLADIRRYYKNREFLPCLDRCEALIARYGDFPEAEQAAAISNAVKSNPIWMENACDHLSNRLATYYLDLAASLLHKNQPQQAQAWLQRVIRQFPGTRYAESAEIRLLCGCLWQEDV